MLASTEKRQGRDLQLAVFRHKNRIRPSWHRGFLMRIGAPSIKIWWPSGLIGAERRANDFGASCRLARQAPESLLVQFERHVVQFDAYSAHFHQRRANVVRSLRIFVFDRAADHLGDHLGARQVVNALVSMISPSRMIVTTSQKSKISSSL